MKTEKPRRRLFNRRVALGAIVSLLTALEIFAADITPARAGGTSRLPVLAARGIPAYECRVVETWEHDPAAFTQGLVYNNRFFYESTGLRGSSSLRKTAPVSGEVLQYRRIPDRYFAEGMTILGGRIYQLTWRSGKCFVYGLEKFDLQNEFSYEGEGWGLTHDGRRLIMSDGSHRLRFIDPVTFTTERVLEVTLLDRPLERLNELEFVRGEIFANVWQTNSIARIDPLSGKVVGLIDVSKLAAGLPPIRRVDVANGIAYDAEKDRLFLTGKLWPKLFHVILKPLESASDERP